MTPILLSLVCLWCWLLLLCAPRVAYDRLVADFEALECVRSQRQRREACGAKEEPPDGDESSGAVAAEEAAERYLSKMPAAHQTRDAVRDGRWERDGLPPFMFRGCGWCVLGCVTVCVEVCARSLLSLWCKRDEDQLLC